MVADSSAAAETAGQEDKGPAIICIIWSITSLGTAFVIARLFTRIKIMRQPGIDDYLIILSLVFGYVFAGLTTASVKAGFGKHATALDTDELIHAIMLNTAGFTPGVLSFVTPKLAVVALLTKIMNPSRRHRIFLWVLAGSCAVLIIGCCIILYAQCSPPSALWDVTLTTATCWSPWVLVDYSIFAGGFSAFVDLYLAVYPAMVLFNLRMSIKKKLALSVALGLGTIACAVSIYKCTRLPGLTDKEDFTYSTADLVVWTNTESNTIIIAACIPTLAPLVEMLLGKTALGSSSGLSRYNQYSKRSGHLRTTSIELTNRERITAKSTARDGVESQESILNVDEMERRPSGEESDGNQINRTDEVVVEYEEQKTDTGKTSASWKRDF